MDYQYRAVKLNIGRDIIRQLVVRILIYNIDGFIQLNEEHRILICRKCNTILQPNTFKKHFQRIYQLTGNILREINDYYTGMELADPENDTLPADGSAAIKLLPVLKGYSCTAYRYLTVARDNTICYWREV